MRWMNRDLGRRETQSASKAAQTPNPVAWSRSMEHEYFRTGALTYLPAWDVHRANLFGRCEPTTTIGAVDRLVEQVMAVEPYAPPDRRTAARKPPRVCVLDGPAVTLVHTPNHASWLNQVEM